MSTDTNANETAAQDAKDLARAIFGKISAWYSDNCETRKRS